MATHRHQAVAEADRTAADAALERADMAELHALFVRSQERFTQMEDALTKVVVHYVGGKEVPRYEGNNDNAIAAMKEIALEALSLARMVAEQAGK